MAYTLAMSRVSRGPEGRVTIFRQIINHFNSHRYLMDGRTTAVDLALSRAEKILIAEQPHKLDHGPDSQQRVSLGADHRVRIGGFTGIPPLDSLIMGYSADVVDFEPPLDFETHLAGSLRPFLVDPTQVSIPGTPGESAG